MDLSHNVLKAILKRGYQQPTPIQRKAIPVVLKGRDVVAMARTGSGKTACFLIPLLERLKVRSSKIGVRALILSPTRELALQTLRFLGDLGRFVGLKTAVILGGDPMEEQFNAIHSMPDVIVATPGRLLHICVEMNLKLSAVEYVVFDEADRLFEMGLAEQLTEIVHRLPDSRQTVLFSATLPKMLVEFAKAGLSDPVLVRLDVETKIPPELQLCFLGIRPDEKMAGLLVLLKTICGDEKCQQQTIVFAATKHHVEYIHAVLNQVNISSTYVYSNLDSVARKMNTNAFVKRKVNVLVVTDVAARGIDIPHLDNVINYNFPGKPKLFVHRVGRCARAGRTGTAFSLVAPDEYAHFLDLHLFLGRPIHIATVQDHLNKSMAANSSSTISTFGKIPQILLEEHIGTVTSLNTNCTDIEALKSTSEKGYQHYLRTRPTASVDSNRRVKKLPFGECTNHKLFQGCVGFTQEMGKETWLNEMKNYRPNGTVFEICAKNNSNEYQVMKQKRSFHKDTIEKYRQTVVAERNNENQVEFLRNQQSISLPINNMDLNETFSDVIAPKRRKFDNMFIKKMKKQKSLNQTVDNVFIPYAPQDRHTEDGLVVNDFQKEVNNVEVDMIGDSEEQLKRSSQTKKWDRRKKKMVGVQDKRIGKIRTESGVWIPASYKSQRYAEWKERSKIESQQRRFNDDENTASLTQSTFQGKSGNLRTHWAKHNAKLQRKKHQKELKSNEQIFKRRIVVEKKKQREKRNHQRKTKARNKSKKR